MVESDHKMVIATYDLKQSFLCHNKKVPKKPKYNLEDLVNNRQIRQEFQNNVNSFIDNNVCHKGDPNSVMKMSLDNTKTIGANVIGKTKLEEHNIINDSTIKGMSEGSHKLVLDIKNKINPSDRQVKRKTISKLKNGINKRVKEIHEQEANKIILKNEYDAG